MNWVLPVAGAVGAYLLYRRIAEPTGYKLVFKSAVPTIARWAAPYGKNVPPSIGVLVPAGLIQSGAIFDLPWGCAITGKVPINILQQFAAVNDIPFVGYGRKLLRPMTHGDLSLPDSVVITPEAWERLPDYYRKMPAVHSSDFGVFPFPPAEPREGELSAWTYVLHQWLYGGPLGWRNANVGSTRAPIFPGVRALYESSVGKKMLGAAESWGPENRVVSGQWCFERSSGIKQTFCNDANTPSVAYAPGWPEYIWPLYILMCCKLASCGYLTRPSGDMTIGRFHDKSGGNIFSSVLSGWKETVTRYPEVFIGAAIGGPAGFAKAAAMAGVKTIVWMANQARDTGERVPWMQDWTPVVVNRWAIGADASDKKQFHTFGTGTDDATFPSGPIP